TSVIQQAISRLPMAQRQVLIKLNPADIKLLQENGIEVDEHDWKLEADDNIAVGGCLVESETARIDLRLETRMRQLTSQLFDGLKQPDENSELNINELDDSSGLEISDE
ncbi:MAG: hypothetical protein KAU21_10265, partial [Gammaproteobacteria bacterium]|nr:hypothetical protein [Gammaproteobacteria bacterium]